MTSSLRDEIAEIIAHAVGRWADDDPVINAADAVLKHPEIAEALAEAEQTRKFRRTIGHSISTHSDTGR